MLFGSRHRAAHCPWSLRASVLYVSFPALLLSGRLALFIFSMVLMQGFILEAFLTSLNGRGLEFPIHLNFNKSLALTQAGLPFPHGRGAGGAGDKEWTHLSPSPAAHEASVAPFRGSGPWPCRTRCCLPREKLVSSHRTVSAPEYKQGQGWVHPGLSLSHFTDWTGLTEGCAYYCRRRASLSPLLTERRSKCILLFATLSGHQK